MIEAVWLSSPAGGIIFDEEIDGNIIVLQSGLAGFGMVQSKVRIEDSAGSGGVFRHSRKGLRDIDLPVSISGSSEFVSQKASLLASILSNSPKLYVRVTNADPGSSPVTYSLDVVHVGGGDAQFGNDVGRSFCNWIIQLQAPQPFWVADTIDRTGIGSGLPRNGFIKNLTKLPVTSSQVFGTVALANYGSTVACPATWEIRGPLTSLKITNADGKGFEFIEPIPAGEVITVNTEQRTVVNSKGENCYSMLAPAPFFFPIPPGESTAQVIGLGAEAGSSVNCRYNPRVEVLL